MHCLPIYGRSRGPGTGQPPKRPAHCFVLQKPISGQVYWPIPHVVILQKASSFPLTRCSATWTPLRALPPHHRYKFALTMCPLKLWTPGSVSVYTSMLYVKVVDD